VPVESLTDAVPTFGRQCTRSRLSSGRRLPGHLRVLQFAQKVVDLRRIGAVGLRLRELPLVLPVLAELEGGSFGCDRNGGYLVLIEREEPLVAKVVYALVQVAFVDE